MSVSGYESVLVWALTSQYELMDVGLQTTVGIFLSKSGDTVLEKCWRKQTSLQAEDWFSLQNEK